MGNVEVEMSSCIFYICLCCGRVRVLLLNLIVEEVGFFCMIGRWFTSYWELFVGC